MNEVLLSYYNTQWKKYTTSSSVINNLFRYLNRYWVKRTAEEGRKDIFEIYTVFFLLFPSLISHFFISFFQKKFLYHPNNQT